MGIKSKVLSIRHWMGLILAFMLSTTNHEIRCSSKEKIFGKLAGQHYLDSNTHIAWETLLRDRLTEQVDGKFFTIDFSKKTQILELINGKSIEEEAEIMQPQKAEFEGLDLVFVTESMRDIQGQGKYYFCTRKDDPQYWVVLVKTSVIGQADRYNLGSFNDLESKISKIWAATQTAAKQAKDGRFIRKRVEEIEPKACGNNRRPSKAALDIFKEIGLVKVVEIRGNSEIYELTGNRPSIQNLDTIFAESAKAALTRIERVE